MIDLFTADELDQLAARVARISPPSSSNPHAFHEQRSEVAGQIRALASKLRNRPVPIAAADVPAPIGRQRTTRHQVQDLEGRSVLVLTRSVPGCSASLRSQIEGRPGNDIRDVR